MDESILDLFACIGITVLICLFVGALLLVSVNLASVNLAASHFCEAKAERLGLEYDYRLFQGCFVKDNGKWIAYKNYRVLLHE